MKNFGVYSLDVMHLRVRQRVQTLGNQGLAAHYPTGASCVKQGHHNNDCKGLEFTVYRLLEQWEVRLGETYDTMTPNARAITARSLSQDMKDSLGTDLDADNDLVLRH